MRIKCALNKEVSQLFRYRLITVGIIILIFLAVGLLGSGLAWMQAPLVQAYNRTNLIRLHVIGNSNSVEDQAIKIKVRNRIIKITEPLLIKVEDPDQAGVILTHNLPVIRVAAEDELKRNRRNLAVQVSLGEEFFPERVYPFGVLPEGRYKGLLIKLGKAKGQNWWCILYPPLCLLNPDAPSFRERQTKPVKVEYRLMAFEKLIKNKGLAMDRFWTGWAKYLGIM
jgi:stage II sporulation protein R